MKIAIGTRHFETIAGHAGRTRDWLLFDAKDSTAIPAPERIALEKAQLIHHFEGLADGGAHPLDGAEIIVSGSAGEGFFRHMAKRGARVLLTGEEDPLEAVRKILCGEALPPTRFDITTMMCKVHDLFSKH